MQRDSNSGAFSPWKLIYIQVVDLLIKKITHAPESSAPQPYIESAKNFMMSPNPLHVEARLDKERYIHGETIYVHITIGNQSTRAVKKLRLSVKQIANICLFSNAIYNTLNVQPSQTTAQTFSIRPLLEENKDKRGLALDGQIKSEDTNLASSTIALPISTRESLGIVVKYIVKIELAVSMGGVLPPSSEVKLELPFTLSHPIPEHHEEDMEPIPCASDANTDNINLELHDESGAYNNASTTAEALPISTRESLGIVVKYIVKIELAVSMGGVLPPSSEVKLELPFTLSHPIPEHHEEDMEPIPCASDANTDNINLELHDESGAYNNASTTAE
eukprot:sb/3466600/